MSNEMIHLILTGILETLYMTLGATLGAYLLGLPLGILLVISRKESPIFSHPLLNKILDIVINILRSVPFLILMVAIIPFTRFVVGTSIGSSATLVPLIVAAAPFVARLVEQSLEEVDKGIIEAALSMGAKTRHIIFHVYLKETLPSLILGFAIASTTILGYSAMAGFVGGGGLGAIAINYGYYRYENDVMIVTVILLVILVAIFQNIGLFLNKKFDHRRH